MCDTVSYLEVGKQSQSSGLGGCLLVHSLSMDSRYLGDRA